MKKVNKDRKMNKTTFESSKNKKNWIETDEPCRDDKSRKNLSVKIIFPSESGSTRCPDNKKAKYTAKYYRLRLKYCKTLIKILIAAKTENCKKKYINKSLRFIDENYKNNRSVETDDLKHQNHPPTRIEVTDENNNVRSCKPGKKIPEKKFLLSTRKLQHDKRDDHESTMIRSTSPQREPHDDQNAESQNLSDSTDDVTIIETGQSKKESRGLKSKEIKEASFFVANDEIDWSTSIERSNPGMKDNEDNRSSSGLINSSKSKPQTAGGKRNDEKVARPSESKKCEHDKTENLNLSKSSDKKTKSLTGGNRCLCKIEKLKSVPATTSSNNKVIESPSALKFCSNGRGKSDQDADLELVELSQIREKKPKKFYSPLELTYSKKLRSKFEDSKNNLAKKNEETIISKPSAIRNGSSTNFQESSQQVEQNILSPLRNGTYFSKYSIPVSIKINMVPLHLRKPESSIRTKQSKLTNYYPLGPSNRKKSNSNLVDVTNNFEKNDERRNVEVGNSKKKSRSLPVIQSNVLLQSQDEIRISSQKYPLERPKLSISRREEYLYNLFKYPVEQVKVNVANQPGNQNIIYCDNFNLSQRYNKVTNENAGNNNIESFNIPENSFDSIVPPSYSISSDDENDDPTLVGVDNNMIDSRELTEMFADSWDSVDDIKNADFS